MPDVELEISERPTYDGAEHGGRPGSVVESLGKRLRGTPSVGAEQTSGRRAPRSPMTISLVEAEVRRRLVIFFAELDTSGRV